MGPLRFYESLAATASAPAPPAARRLRPPPASFPLARESSLNFFFFLDACFLVKKYRVPDQVTKPTSAAGGGVL